MESDKSGDINIRLNQWVASQGFFFQLKYSMGDSGAAGTVFAHALRLFLRLLLLVFIVGIGFTVYLYKRPGTQSFQSEMKVWVKTGLSAKDAEISGVQHENAQLSFGSIACLGSADTFYSQLEAKSVRAKMHLLGGVMGTWDLGNVSIYKLDINLNAGADRPESARNIAASLFKKSEDVILNGLTISDATIRWGYSDRTYGSIENSSVNVMRYEKSIKLLFKGGTFSQNWLRNLEILEMIVICTPDGFTFEKAEFRQGVATVNFSGLHVAGGERPTLKGVMKVKHLSLENLLPSTMTTYLDGLLSGQFQVGGSTNSVDGISFQGAIALDGRDSIAINDKLPVIKAISDIDYIRNYHRIIFKSGGFDMSVSSGKLTVTNLKIKSEESLTLAGGMTVRPPTTEETRASALKAEAAKTNLPEEQASEKMKDDPEETLITLARAARESKKRIAENPLLKSSSAIANRIFEIKSIRAQNETAAEDSFKTLRFEGELLLALPNDAFELAPRLLAQFPVDPKTKKIPFKIPLSGDFLELTAPQAAEIYKLRGR